MAEAIAAKRAFQGLQLLLAEIAAENGVSLDRLQDKALFTRTMLWTPEEVALVQHFTDGLGAVMRHARERFKALVAGHRPAYPERLGRALDELC